MAGTGHGAAITAAVGTLANAFTVPIDDQTVLKSGTNIGSVSRFGAPAAAKILIAGFADQQTADVVTEPIITSGASAANPGHIAVVMHPLTVNGIAYDGVLLVRGPSSFLNNVRRATIHSHVNYQDDAQAFAHVPIIKNRTAAFASQVPIVVYTYCAIEQDKLVEMMCSNNLTTATKMLSGLYALFPAIREYIAFHFDLLDLPPVVQGATAGLAANESAFQICTAFVTLTGSYTRQEKLAQQILSRLKAAAASSDTRIPTLGEVQSVMQATNWAIYELPGPLILVIQTIVCVDKTGRVDQNLKQPNIMPLKIYATTYFLDVWTMAILAQMRLVFENFHSTSIRFAFAVQPMVRHILAAIGQKWREESDAISALSAAIGAAPYSGIVDVVPDNQQIAKFPRLVYIGLLWYKTSLGTAVEIENFDKYNIDGTKNHIEPASDLNLCEGVVRTMPTSNLQAVISLASVVGASETEIMVAGMPTNQQEIVYKSLVASGNPGEWARARLATRTHAKLTELRTAALASMSTLTNNKYNSLMQAASDGADQATTARLRTEASAWRAKVILAQEGLVDFEAMVPQVEGVEFTTLRKDLMKALSGLYVTIKSSPTDSPATLTAAIAAEEAKHSNRQ